MVRKMETKKYKIDMKKIGITAAKIVIGTAASFGTGFIVSRYGKAVILPTDKKLNKLLMLFGASTLACMVGNAAEEYVDKAIDQCVDAVENISRLGKTITENKEAADDSDFEEVENG